MARPYSGPLSRQRIQLSIQLIIDYPQHRSELPYGLANYQGVWFET